MGNSSTLIEGVVTENLPGVTFRVELTDGRTMLCHLSGKMRLNWIKLLPGDRVRVEITPYDVNRGRIVFKLK